MASVLYIHGIDTLTGALDSEKEGQAKRARLISRRNKRIDKWISPDGRLWHQLYEMRMHEGAWSEGATKNREIIKVAQRIAHDIERICKHPEEYDTAAVEGAKVWETRYAEYRKTFPEGNTDYKLFYGWMYSEIYKEVRKEAGLDQA